MHLGKTIMGASACYHDSAATLVRHGKILAVAQAESFTRKKHEAGFPSNAFRYCLDKPGIGFSRVDKVVFYDRPIVKFERPLENYLSCAPNGLRCLIAAMPILMKEKL